MSSRWRSPSTSDPRRALVAIAAALLALAAAACSPAAATAVAAAPAAKPAVDAGPVFDHKAHLAKGLECADCHEDAGAADDVPMPAFETCNECHEELDEEKPPEKRATAFLDPATKKPRWRSVSKQPDEVKFSHVPHAKRSVACAECHRGIEESTSVATMRPLTMDDCTSCHAAKHAPNECETCHREYGLEKAPPSHDRLWDVRHGQIVRRGGTPSSRLETCSLCHTESTCISCHREEPPRDHTNFWRDGPGHGLAASLDRERCAACHTTDACSGCHATNPPRSHRGAWGSPRNRHCLGCHDEPASKGSGGCFTCHDGTPSHASAPAKPAGHRADSECLLCHQDDLRHPVIDRNCNTCHR